MSVTTDQLYQQYKGTSIPSFDGKPKNNGQCEQWYLMVRTKRDGLPVVYGNAIDRWLQKEPEHYDYITFAPGVYPKKDDYVIWGTGVGSSAGHVDVCAQNGTAAGFLGYDSNWEDIPKLTTIQHNYGFGILGYIRSKGQDMPTAGNVNTVIFLGLRRKATQPEIDKFSKLEWGKLFDYVQTVQTAHDIIPRPPLGKAATLDYINNHLT